MAADRPASHREPARKFSVGPVGGRLSQFLVSSRRSVPAGSNQGWVEFGERMRKLRKERFLSLDQAAGKVGCSRAALSRYERGEVLVPMALAEDLDALYRADGELVSERRTLMDGSWLPRGAFRTRWEHPHPAAYAGPVWMRVVPDPVFASARHRVEVRWGNWRLCHEEPLDTEGAFFAHMKLDDDQSKPLEVSVTPACLVVFGRGEPPGQPVIDINHGWSHWVAFDILHLVRARSPRLATALERLLQRAPLPFRRG